SFRVMTHVLLRLFDRALQIALAAEELYYPPVTMRTEGVGFSRHTFRQQPAYLVDQPVCEVLLRTLIDARIEFRAWRVQGNDAQPGSARVRLRAQRSLFRHRFAGLTTYFNS